MSQERRNDLNKAVRFMMAKMCCRGHALSCFLDDLPWELVPRQARDGCDPASDDAELVVNSSFRYEPKGESPQAMRQRTPPMDGLLRGVPLAWVRDSGTGVWTPFWVRGEWTNVLGSLQAGQPAPASLSPRARQALIRAHVLVPPGAEQEHRAAWEQICRDARVSFQSYGYAIVRNLIHPVHMGALRRYYRALVAGGQLPRGDSQVAERYRLHSEPVGMFFHPQLASVVGRIAGEPVKPSYLYFASYPSGSALPRHVDRAQCEFSVSLLVDYSPDPDGPCGWPLFLEHPSLPGGVVAADLGIGDAVFYRGRQLVHYRDPLPEGHQSTSVFFHYLREDFVGDTF
jgi:hypothetical protein